MSDTTEAELLEAVDRVANDVCRDVCELPDRSSPEDQPSMLLVTTDELHGIVAERVSSFLSMRVETERGEAIEECAKLLDGWREADRLSDYVEPNEALAHIADAIRSLTTTTGKP